jgi:hypothetical protein
MALSAAERAKKYRENLKNNPIKYNDYLKQEKQRYRGRKERGTLTLNFYFSIEQRRMKRKWRNQKRNEREQKKKKP